MNGSTTKPLTSYKNATLIHTSLFFRQPFIMRKVEEMNHIVLFLRVNPIPIITCNYGEGIFECHVSFSLNILFLKTLCTNNLSFRTSEYNTSLFFVCVKMIFSTGISKFQSKYRTLLGQ